MDVKTEEVTIEDVKIECEQHDDDSPKIEERDRASISSESVDLNDVSNWVKTEYSEDSDCKELGAGVYDEHSVSSTDAAATEIRIKEEPTYFEEIYVKQEVCDDNEVASPEVAEDESDMGEVDSEVEITFQSPRLMIRKAAASTTVHDFLTIELPATSASPEQNHLHSRKTKKIKTCDTCGQGFRTRLDLKKHVGTHKKPYKCILCNKILNTQKSIERHIKWHTAETLYTCDLCKSSFISRRSLVCHLKIHNKFIKCSICIKTFASEKKFALHWGLHIAETPYPCDVCKDRFRTHADLLAHLKKSHPAKKMEKPVECATCGKTFLTLSMLTTHMRLHTGERPYACQTCGERFTDHWILSNHLMTHEESKPFVCITCGVRFSMSSKLKSHLTLHTMEEQLTCKVCGEAVGIGNVARHLNCRSHSRF